jgi:hypothetical protein
MGDPMPISERDILDAATDQAAAVITSTLKSLTPTSR